jgi:hypothetical protein
MNSIRLVLLSLVVGIAIGAGFMAARQGGVSSEKLAEPSTLVHSTDANADAKRAATGAKSNGSPEDGYHRVAKALISLDGRLSLMEAREESSLEKQNRVVDQIREIAIALEVKSGELKPLRESRSTPLEPLRSRTNAEALAVEPPVPVERPGARPASRGGEELPEW